MLTVAAASFAAPWLERSGGGYRGFEADVARHIARGLDARLKWTGNESLADFTIGRISSHVAGRTSDGYFDNPYALLVVKGAPITDATPLYVKDYRYGTVDVRARAFVDSVIEPTRDAPPFPGFREAQQALERGAIDAIVTHVAAAIQLRSRSPTYEVIASFPQYGLPLRVQFPAPGELISCVNGVLADLDEDGTLERLQKRWLREYITVPKINL